MDRRNKSVERYYALEEKLTKQAEDAQRQNEKRAIDEQMLVERHERKTIKNAKKAEL